MVSYRLLNTCKAHAVSFTKCEKKDNLIKTLLLVYTPPLELKLS
jgi:hypothetical protein